MNFIIKIILWNLFFGYDDTVELRKMLITDKELNWKLGVSYACNEPNVQV